MGGGGGGSSPRKNVLSILRELPSVSASRNTKTAPLGGSLSKEGDGHRHGCFSHGINTANQVGTKR